MQLDFGELWTRKNVREMIRREFRVKLSDVQVGRVLRDIGLSPQKPLYRSYKQNPELVEEWKKVIYPKIRARAAAEGAEILFGDEASVRTDHHAGTTWAPVGQTPVVRDSGKRQAVKMISAISPQGLTIFNCGSYWRGVRSSLGLARKPSRRPGWYCIRRSRVLTSAVS